MYLGCNSAPWALIPPLAARPQPRARGWCTISAPAYRSATQTHSGGQPESASTTPSSMPPSSFLVSPPPTRWSIGASKGLEGARVARKRDGPYVACPWDRPRRAAYPATVFSGMGNPRAVRRAPGATCVRPSGPAVFGAERGDGTGPGAGPLRRPVRSGHAGRILSAASQIDGQPAPPSPAPGSRPSLRASAIASGLSSLAGFFDARGSRGPPPAGAPFRKRTRTGPEAVSGVLFRQGSPRTFPRYRKGGIP